MRDQKVFMVAAEVAPLINWDPQTVRLMARENPEKFPFPFEIVVHGKRVQFTTKSVMEWLKDHQTESEVEAL